MIKMSKKINHTLKKIIDFIIYENPSTQDEIANNLGISRRYVTKLIKPLIDEGVIRRAYIFDLKNYEDYAGELDKSKVTDRHSGIFLIKDMLREMYDHVNLQLYSSFNSLEEHNIKKANKALKMDIITNNLLEKIRSSVDTVISMDPSSEFSKIILLAEMASDLERIGDYSCHISKFVIYESSKVDSEMLIQLRDLYENAKKMFEMSVDAFLNGNVSQNKDIMELENLMHILQKKAINTISKEISQANFNDNSDPTHYIYLSRIVKAFERIADISIEIADKASSTHLNLPRNITPEDFR